MVYIIQQVLVYIHQRWIIKTLIYINYQQRKAKVYDVISELSNKGEMYPRYRSVNDRGYPKKDTTRNRNDHIRILSEIFMFNTIVQLMHALRTYINSIFTNRKQVVGHESQIYKKKLYYIYVYINFARSEFQINYLI